MSGIYIAYPFCSQKCTFCNFASDVYTHDVRHKYLRHLLREIAEHHWAFRPDTLYFGGGTPSLMTPEEFASVFQVLPREILSEITLECAPGTVTTERVALWRQLGINRISLGVQSFVTDEIRAVGRRHTAAMVISEIQILRNGGFDNISVDLIAGLPHQTWESWQQSLRIAIQLAVPHLSVYMFEVDEHSSLGKEALLGGVRYGAGVLPHDETVAEFYAAAVETLEAAEVRRYEISNFARKGWESKHNLKYWHREPYIGFGLDAHSFDGQRRWSNTDAISDYLAGTPPEEEAVHVAEERFMVGLRLASGFQPTPDERKLFADPIDKWKALGLLEDRSSYLRLSNAGILLSNEVLQDFLLLHA